jgi:hypothetical protein
MLVIHTIADKILPFLMLTRSSFGDQSVNLGYAAVCILKTSILGC